MQLAKRLAASTFCYYGGTTQIRTGESGFCRPLPYHLAMVPYTERSTHSTPFYFGAGDEARTRYLHLGKVALYQMSYTRNLRRLLYTLSPICQAEFFKTLIFFFPSTKPCKPRLVIFYFILYNDIV